MIMDKSPTVLIVDDDQSICDFVGETLAEDGYACEIALNAHDALVKMRNHFFDIALLDIKLPDKSGIDFLETSQLFSQTTSTIMMTAVKDIDTVIQAMKMGASDYVVKPFTIERLTASISAVLRNRKRPNSVSIQFEKVENTNRGRNAVGQSLKTINAIAIGVDAQVDYFDFHSKIVTEKTVDLARRLSLPAKEIEKWKVTRNKQYTERREYISLILGNLERNPLAQVMLGLTCSVNEFPKAGGEQN
jgi:FixJ family two-component response regulator